jgi:hypothetical protein
MRIARSVGSRRSGASEPTESTRSISLITSPCGSVIRRDSPVTPGHWAINGDVVTTGLLDYQRALVRFLSASLSEKRERLVGFALSPKKKTQQKITTLVYHELECMLKPEVQVPTLPDGARNSKAYLFCEPRHNGTEFSTLNEAMNHAEGNQERLAITHDGVCGCLRTEMSGDIYVDTRARRPNHNMQTDAGCRPRR